MLLGRDDRPGHPRACEPHAPTLCTPANYPVPPWCPLWLCFFLYSILHTRYSCIAPANAPSGPRFVLPLSTCQLASMSPRASACPHVTVPTCPLAHTRAPLAAIVAASRGRRCRAIPPSPHHPHRSPTNWRQRQNSGGRSRRRSAISRPLNAPTPRRRYPAR